MRRLPRALLFAHATACACLVAAAAPVAAETFSRGGIGIETRAFDPDDLDETEDVGLSLYSQLELSYKREQLRMTFQGFARLATFDDSRNIVGIQEAYMAYAVGPVEITAGARLLNWTATEVFHPADIINSANFDSNPLDPEKLGEPMIELKLRLFRGFVTGYYLPVRLDPQFVPASSRLTLLQPGTKLGDVIFVNRDGFFSDSHFQHQGGVRINQVFGPADIAVHFIDHTQRQQPAILFDGAINPLLQSVRQFGLTYTHIVGPLIFKLEGAARQFYEIDADLLEEIPFEVEPIPDHQIVAGGLEYAWTTLGGSAISAVVEAQVVIEKDREERRRIHPFQRDVLIAYRHAFNDLKNREILVGVITDLEEPTAYAITGEYSQRLSDHFTIEGRVLAFRQTGDDTQSAEVILMRHF